jgi:polyisoprenoid-binding protein YceI
MRLPSVALRPLLAGAALLSAGAASAEPARWVIDPEHLSIVFSAKHIGYESVWGMFLRGEGSFTFDEATQDLSDLVFTVDAKSVFSNLEARDDHLRSDAFLDANSHPEIRFVMTGAEKATETTGKVTGDLTMRGVTKPVTVDVRLNKIGPYPFGPNYVLGVTVTTTLKRSDWGSTYALEGDLVADEIPLIIELEAIRQDD